MVILLFPRSSSLLPLLLLFVMSVGNESALPPTLSARCDAHCRIHTSAARPAGPARAAGAGEPQDLSRADEGRAAEQAQGAERRVRRLPQLRAGRRSAVPRLEPLRPARQADPQAVPGRRGPALLHADRRQPVDGFRQADEAAVRQAAGRGAGVHRPDSRRSRADRDARAKLRTTAGPVLRGRRSVWRMLEYLDGIEAGRNGVAGRGREELLPAQLGQGHRRADLAT